MYLLIVSLLVLVLVGLNKILNIYQSDIEKISAYECGMAPMGDARQKFDISFYVIAILFLLLDLEIILIFPYATIPKLLGWFGYWGFIILTSLVTIGLVYELKKMAPNSF